MKKKRNIGNFSSNVQLRAIVVGSSTDDFVQYTANLLEDYDIEFAHCGDVYSAVGELAKSISGNVLAIGRLEQLSREQGRFFHIASDKGIWCCCLVDGSLIKRHRYLGPELTANQAAVSVINEPAQIEQVITRLLADNLASSPCKKENKSSDFIKDEFLTTKAELDALLGT